MIAEAENFIREHLLPAPVEGLREISIYKAHSRSGLHRFGLQSGSDAPPYWAFAWAGGAALARHVLDHPQLVAGRRILDIGAGSGLVAIAAMKAGAKSVIAAETDGYGVAALRLNAMVNEVALTAHARDMTRDTVPDVDLVLAGDVFYSRDVARRMLAFLRRCRAAGLDVLIGDPGRTHLPATEMQAIDRYDVVDVGTRQANTPATVYALKA